MGIGPTLLAWKAKVLPLNYICILFKSNYVLISDDKVWLNKVDNLNYTKNNDYVNIFVNLF